MQTLDEALRAGEGFLASGQYQQALGVFDAVFRTNPRCAEAANGAAIALSQMGQVGLSIGMFNCVLMMAPQSAEVWANLGMSLRRAGHTEWARDAYHKSLSINPKCHLALTGLSGSYVNEGDPEPGVMWGKKALEVAPAQETNAHNLALCLMELGRWREAWPHWQRRVLPRHEARKYPGERWQGQPVDVLVVHGEQGLGDEVMFLGCLPQLQDRAGHLVIEVAPRLVRLVAEAFPRAEVIGAQAEYTPRDGGVHAWVPLGDLPALCPDGVPPRVSGYLRPKPIMSDDVLLAMRGGTLETHEYLRNPFVADWAPLVDAIRAKGLRPVSIQYGADGAALAARMGVEHDAEAASDIYRQAQRIAGCRALVSVQQTALHLGGAVGARVLGIVGNKPAWRYGLAGPMPWYQTVELYRQAKEEKDWKGVMHRVAEAV